MLNSMVYNFLREEVKKITIDSLTAVKPGGGKGSAGWWSGGGGQRVVGHSCEVFF